MYLYEFFFTFEFDTIRSIAFLKSLTKQWISLSLLSLMLVKVMVIPLLYLDFEVRRDYIIANLCENRNRPQLHCDGKCYLAKKIADAKKQEEKQAENDFLSKLLVSATDLSAFRSIAIAPEFAFTFLKTTKFSFATSFWSSNNIRDIFHPPLC
ncbi:hypothetical protein [Dyadobacter arcticus]|uniref:Uncharacterized protein n=1 Tax=Dyadobacter arcticus TaxID=1078754 RepID=A0ABX0UUN8_9BACT|nr:hypothetical protein [Dyadobacter arcticus]NIJ55360.1 hypothetical protein [Dyadobacter arcticus]